MSYTVELTPGARRDFRALTPAIQNRVREAISRLAQEPRPAGCRKLTNRDAWRIRIGDYRVIYQIQDDKLVVLVVEIGHRRDVYR